MMDWSALLSPWRRGYNAIQRAEETRNPFEQDYSRVVFSSAVRRLQDKAQVFPLESTGYVRTRLSHSMEVSALGRSLGARVEGQLIARGLIEPERRGEIASILATAGLIHDLGNPPFGHYGEEVIQKFFAGLFAKDELGLSPAQRGDFVRFDGNAQALRYLTRVHYMYDRPEGVVGYDLSAATLSTLMKYPRASLEVNPERGLSYKKIGYFQSEKATFEQVRDHVGVGEARHPLVFLLEAADDIAYMLADVEDGVKKGALSADEVLEFLGDRLTTERGRALVERIGKSKQKINPKFPRKGDILTQWLRVYAQGDLIQDASDAFFGHLDEMMEGTYEQELLSEGYAGELAGALKELGHKRIYVHPAAVMKELAGGKALEGLLSAFTEAVLAERSDYRLKGMYAMISENFRFIAEQFPSDPDSPYDRLLLVTDFVSGMTDSYAIEVYQRLAGIRMGS